MEDSMIERLLEKYGEDFLWFELADNVKLKQFLEKRLITELVPEHDLYSKGKNYIAIAKNEGNDDVLFQEGQEYYIVHLTWSTGSVNFPKYKKFCGDEIVAYLENDHLYG